MKKVVVIGAGLAGLYAAYTASIHGADVEVHEKRDGIEAPLKCGEIFTAIYGMPPSECILSEMYEWKFDFSLVSEELEPISIQLPEKTMFMTDRRMHERIIYEKCIDNGVEFIFGSTYDSFGRNFSNITINATGYSGYSKSHSHHYTTAHAYIVESDGYEENVALFKVLPDINGYYWAFPRGKNHLNIGVGYHGEKVHKNIISVKNNIRSISPHDSNIHGMITRGGGRIPFNHNFKLPYHYVRAGEMYVGDAAGLVNPMLCGGEHLSVLSGRIAGYTSAVNDDALYALNRYQKGMVEIIQTEMSVGVLLSQMQDYLSPIEFYNAFKSISIFGNDEINEVSLSYIKRTMAKYITVPDTTENELEELI